MKIEYFDKINKLRDYYVDDPESLDSLKTADEILALEGALKELQDNFAIKELVKDAERTVKAIDFKLLNAPSLGDERDMLIREKKIHKFYLSRLNAQKIKDRLKYQEDLVEREFKQLFPGEEEE